MLKTLSVSVLPVSVFIKKSVFCALFQSGVFFSWKMFFSAFFIKMCFFYNDGKNYC